MPNKATKNDTYHFCDSFFKSFKKLRKYLALLFIYKGKMTPAPHPCKDRNLLPSKGLIIYKISGFLIAFWYPTGVTFLTDKNQKLFNVWLYYLFISPRLILFQAWRANYKVHSLVYKKKAL